MCEVVEISDDEDVPMPQNNVGIKPKAEGWEWVPDLRHEDNGASSSGSNLRSSFIAMGFPPSHVDKAIAETGEGDAELILQTLTDYSDIRLPKTESYDDVLFSRENNDFAVNPRARESHRSSESSDSLGSLFGEDATRNANGGGEIHLKEEPDVDSGVSDKMTSLLKMNFSSDEAGFALDRLGKEASIDELINYILAARMARKYEKDANFQGSGDRNEESKKDCDNEALFGIMEKTLRLFEMGFSEQEISGAFERCGSEVPLEELAESIVFAQLGVTVPNVNKDSAPACSSSGQINGRFLNRCESLDSLAIKTEYETATAPQVGISDLLERLKGKRPKVEPTDEPRNWKKPREEFKEDSSNLPGRTWLDSRRRNSGSASSQVPSSYISVGTSSRSVGRATMLQEDIKPTIYTPNPCKTVTSAAFKPPYFLYGNVTQLSEESWAKISHFMNTIPPEFVNTQSHSALSRTEGYVHNLPTENRFHAMPIGPLTIEEALPHTRKWWPSWDTRKCLSNISCATSGVSHQSETLGRLLSGSNGHVSVQQRSKILEQCEALNLVWVGNYKLAPIEPEHVERIMGYPLHHTRVSGFTHSERLKLLKLSFQTDTLAYHLSVLKGKTFSPEGLTVLSCFSGIGGAEIALHRLGMRLKAVISVEACEKKRRIMKQWWESSGQRGELMQIESIDKISGYKVDDLIKKFGGLDLVVCQNPYTGADSDSLLGLDFSLFVEFVRILQRIRSTLEKTR